MAEIASIVTDQNATVIRALDATVALPVGYESFDPIRSEGQQFVYFANGDAARMKDAEVRPYLREKFGDRFFRAAAASHGAMVDHQRQFLERDARAREPAPSVDRQYDPERRARFRNLEGGALMSAIAVADLPDLVALVASGNLAALPDQAFEEASKRFLVLNTVEKLGLQARFAAKPTLDNPLPVGADVDAARRQAEAILDGHEAEREMIGIHRRGIQDFSIFLGHIFDLTADEAFDRIVGD